MISVELKRPKSGVARHVFKFVAVFVFGGLAPAILHAVFTVFFGISSQAVGLIAVVVLEIPLIVLFLLTEDRDFDWDRYTDRDNDADALLVLAVGAVGTAAGFLLAGQFEPDRQFFWAAGVGCVAAYEVFVYRNRGFFPADTWPWVGSVYFRVRP